MSKPLLALLLLVPTAAAADWTVQAPKGWKREPAAQEKTRVATARKHLPADVQDAIEIKLRAWNAPKGDQSKLGMTATLMVMKYGSDVPIEELIDGLADDARAGMERRGMKTVSAHKASARIKASSWILEGDGMRMYQTIRAVTDKRGAVHVFTVWCNDLVATDGCQTVIPTMQLSVR